MHNSVSKNRLLLLGPFPRQPKLGSTQSKAPALLLDTHVLARRSRRQTASRPSHTLERCDHHTSNAIPPASTGPSRPSTRDRRVRERRYLRIQAPARCLPRAVSLGRYRLLRSRDVPAPVSAHCRAGGAPQEGLHRLDRPRSSLPAGDAAPRLNAVPHQTEARCQAVTKPCRPAARERKSRCSGADPLLPTVRCPNRSPGLVREMPRPRQFPPHRERLDGPSPPRRLSRPWTWSR